MKPKNEKLLSELIVGRVKPHIYAFTTNTIPNFIKIGDTYRPVLTRLQEWMKYYPNLHKEYEESATINDEVFFRDYSVHQYLETDLSKHRLEPQEYPDLYYSNEFFKDVLIEHVSAAISDIRYNYEQNTGKYKYYDSNSQLPEIYTYASTGYWNPRPNQKKTIENFVRAVDAGRNNLLMYAVMRFGKSFTALSCAKAKEYKTVVVVSAKADVREEWKKTVQSADNFNKDYVFVSNDDLVRDEKIVTSTISQGKGVVVFITLQDLQGDTIKDKHQEIFGQQIDLLIVDETHYGARAESYGKVLRSINYEKDVKEKYADEDFVELETAEAQLKALSVKVTLHLSGTPYRILMGSEFEKDDIIAFYQFTDIVKDQENWDKENLLKDAENVKEWDNPYFGFPQMIRFAFVPSKSALALLESLKNSGITYAFSALLKPQSVSKDNVHSLHKKFVYEKEVLELFEAIDGSKEDDGILSFLDYDKIKDGKMCQHIVCVLPYCASCDALEALICKNRKRFKNLQDYTIVNISGVDSPNEYRNIQAVKSKIKQCANAGKKTLTLTVNRMLTGSTVEEWDTMIFLKDTASPQEYDQAIFRLQNQYIKEYISDDGDTIKYNMKPQTLLVDFDPHRLFVMQETKSQIYNANIDASGNQHLRDRLEEELRISPIIMLNKNRVSRVEATDILAVISEYSSSRGVLDETKDIPVDMSLLELEEIRITIESQAELGSRQGLSVETHNGEETDMDAPEDESGSIDKKDSDDEESNNGSNITDLTIEEDDIKVLTNKFRTYYSRILFFAFLTKSEVASLENILSVIENGENIRIAKNLNLEQSVLVQIKEHINIFILRQLDYKIQNINTLARDESLVPMERASVAIRKFGRISDSEITTPDFLANEMMSAIPDDCFRSLKNKNIQILDIASKMGEFAFAIVQRCRKLKIPISDFRSKILSIPTSPIAYEFTRKIYEYLDLDIDNIAQHFNSYDLIQNSVEESENQYIAIKSLLSQKRALCDIELDDKILDLEENNKMVFEAVVGNPPYQELVSKSEGNASLGKNLFPSFTRCAMEVSSRYVSLIIPSKWFAGDGQDHSFPPLRDYAKSHNHFRSIRHYNDSEDIFTGAAPGAVNYFLYDSSYNGDTLFCNDDNTEMLRPLFEEDIDIILPLNSMVSILKKVTSKGDFASLTAITTGRNAFGIIGKTESKISKKEPFAGAYELRCAHEVIKYVSKDKITKNLEIADHWKIFTSKGNGAAGTLGGDSPVSILGKPYVAKPKSVCTDSLFPIGCFESKKEAENLAKYLKTKFVRYLAGVMKVTQNITQIVYKYVPMQAFDSSDDIDWNTSIEEIDKQLYSKYKLSRKEMNIIESSIRAME